MPDLVGFSVVRGASQQLTVPTWTITGKIVDSKTQQTVLADFSGANAKKFPQVLGEMTAAQQDDWVLAVVTDLLHRRFGV